MITNLLMNHMKSEIDKKFIPLHKLTGYPESVIPEGMYCYDSNRRCPYWSIVEMHQQQDNGFCEYLGQGDWNGFGLLWDQVEECNVKDNYSEEDYYEKT